jgi:hypothetical protein
MDHHAVRGDDRADHDSRVGSERICGNGVWDCVLGAVEGREDKLQDAGLTRKHLVQHSKVSAGNRFGKFYQIAVTSFFAFFAARQSPVTQR